MIDLADQRRLRIRLHVRRPGRRRASRGPLARVRLHWLPSDDRHGVARSSRVGCARDRDRGCFAGRRIGPRSSASTSKGRGSAPDRRPAERTTPRRSGRSTPMSGAASSARLAGSSVWSPWLLSLRATSTRSAGCPTRVWSSRSGIPRPTTSRYWPGYRLARRSSHTSTTPCATFGHREPGAIGAALTDDWIVTTVIPDGVHVHPAAIRLLVRAKGTAGVIGVTDSFWCAGLPPGTYPWGSSSVRWDGVVARLPDGRLAGSTLRPSTPR